MRRLLHTILSAILFVLGFIVIYGAWSAGEWALCYSKLRHHEVPIKRHTAKEHCTEVVLFPFNF